MTKNMLGIAGVVVASVFAGACLVIGVGRLVTEATRPLAQEVAILSSANRQLQERIAGLESRLMSDPRGQKPAQPSRPSVDLTTVHDLPVDGSLVLGPVTAPVTVVGFFDLQCPYCARFFPPVQELLAAEGGQVRFVLKHFPLPFHPTARPAAKAVMAAGLQGQGAAMLQLVLENHRDQSEARLIEFAGKTGINAEQFARDLQERDADFEKQIAADMALGAKAGVAGTPAFYLNGRQTMARTTQEWQAEIGEAVKALKP